MSLYIISYIGNQHVTVDRIHTFVKLGYISLSIKMCPKPGPKIACSLQLKTNTSNIRCNKLCVKISN